MQTQQVIAVRLVWHTNRGFKNVTFKFWIYNDVITAASQSMNHTSQTVAKNTGACSKNKTQVKACGVWQNDHFSLNR